VVEHDEHDERHTLEQHLVHYLRSNGNGIGQWRRRGGGGGGGSAKISKGGCAINRQGLLFIDEGCY
jgi:hypothetical protein